MQFQVVQLNRYYEAPNRNEREAVLETIGRPCASVEDAMTVLLAMKGTEEEKVGPLLIHPVDDNRYDGR